MLGGHDYHIIEKVSRDSWRMLLLICNQSFEVFIFFVFSFLIPHYSSNTAWFGYFSRTAWWPAIFIAVDYPTSHFLFFFLCVQQKPL
jgi:hypothetical protein